LFPCNKTVILSQNFILTNQNINKHTLCKNHIMGHIYMLKNKLNGKSYVGQTICPVEERLQKHQHKSSNCRAIYGAIKKYGWDNFEIDWYECLDNELNKHEKWMVNLMRTLSPDGYNLKEGGGSRGKLSEETKQRIIVGNKGKKRSEEFKQKNREVNMGEKNPSYGKPKSEESNQKRREAMSGDNNYWYGKTGEKHHRSKKVYQYALDGTFIDSFGSCEEAGQHIKKKRGGHISSCARGKRKTAHDFKWSYELDIFM
jgi:group I intron endonuclease